MLEERDDGDGDGDGDGEGVPAEVTHSESEPADLWVERESKTSKDHHYFKRHNNTLVRFLVNGLCGVFTESEFWRPFVDDATLFNLLRRRADDLLKIEPQKWKPTATALQCYIEGQVEGPEKRLFAIFEKDPKVTCHLFSKFVRQEVQPLTSTFKPKPKSKQQPKGDSTSQRQVKSPTVAILEHNTLFGMVPTPVFDTTPASGLASTA
ncbi:hypothetical protein Pelo_13616 [Pelomyxa schiedti]|nr:hypothetical protein Pelo_13616 [Pelomyxa schiedti]